MSHPMFEKHLGLLRQAVAAVETRVAWNPFAETPIAYGENAVEAGREAFEAYRDASFYLDQPGVLGRTGSEKSPYGLLLNVKYPQCNPDALIMAGRTAMHAWAKAGADTRVGVCIEILTRLNAVSAELAHAVMHVTGQPFAVAFQLSTINAQDRGLEAVAAAFRELKQLPDSTDWERSLGKNQASKISKRFSTVPRGPALVIASAVSPTLNSYPAVFASLATGNPVIVKPHPDAILPLAMLVAVARQTIKDAGFDSNLVSLLVDDESAPSAKLLSLKPELKIIDYTGSSELGEWIEENATQAEVFTQKSSVNCVVVDSTSDYKGMLRNLTLSLSLYSGQICTAPRVLLVASDGIATPEGNISAEQFEKDLVFAIGKLVEDPARAVDILGVIQSPAIVSRIDEARELGDVLRDSGTLTHPHWPEACVRTPLLIRASVADETIYMEERFGPIATIVGTSTVSESIAIAERIAREKGSLILSVYSTNAHLQELAADAAMRAGVNCTLNFTGSLLLSQSIAFSDLHGTGANPAGNCALIDSAYVARRFQIVSMSRQV
jgi:phenylacetic acid degradation protein paaN